MRKAVDVVNTKIVRRVRVTRLAAAARHVVILEPGSAEEGADAPIEASRLGGMPHLPPEVPWPWRPALPSEGWKEVPRNVQEFLHLQMAHEAGSWPLSFIAQIDCAEIHSAGGLEGFPSSGRLLFFCDPTPYPVLQIDSDLGADIQWGDAGRLYVCIRKQDLAKRRFDRCWTAFDRRADHC